MAGGKQSPRQKMINMMYLVLTAMLALNVSKEILDAFVVVNVGLLQQRDNLTAKNSNMYGAFDQQVVADPKNAKVKFLNDQAVGVGAVAKELSDYIKNMKVELITAVDGAEGAEEKAEQPHLVEKKDDYDLPTNFFGTDDEAKAGRGEGKAAELKAKLATYKENLLSTVDKVLNEYIKDPSRKKIVRDGIVQRLDIINLNDPEAGDQEAHTWEMKYFYHLPLSAALTELTKWENIVKGAESEVLTFLWDQISATAFKFDAVEAKIIPKSTFVVSGSNFEAEVFLAAYSTSSKPTVIVGTGVDSTSGEVLGGQPLTADQIVDGKGLLQIPASGTGEHTVAGVIEITDPSGVSKRYPFSTIYNVSPPSATVAPTKMNVFYIGLENPLSVSVPGVAPGNISVSCSNASFSGSGGNYIVKPSGPGECVVSVTAKMADGKSTNMGTYKFRSKRVPNPVLMWNSQASGGGFNAQLGGQPIIPTMPDFDFDVYAKVRSMTIGFSDKDGNFREYPVNGNSPGEASGGIAKLPKGRKVYIDAKVEVPGGEVRNISGVWQIR